jgi:hypothetical protein
MGMAFIEDILKGNLAMVAALGATAVVLPKIFPALSPPLRSAVKSGLSLFVESEAEAEGGIVNRLADNALKTVLKQLSGPGTADERQASAEGAMDEFRKTAHARTRRYGRDDADRSARYRRHVKALRRAIERERSRHSGAKAEALSDLSARLTEAD